MLTAIKATIKGPIFSIQRPLSYQVGDSLILPQPSTLASALAYCFSKSQTVVLQGLGDDYLKNLAGFVRRGLVRVAIKPLTPIVLTPILLSRLRTLEWTINEIMDKISSGEKITNVMVREYAFGTYSTYFLFTNDKIARKSMELLPLLDRIGDTESLIYVSEVEKAEFIGKEKSGQVDTYTPCDWVESISENYVILRLCEEEYAEHRFKKIKGKPSEIAKTKLELFLKFSKNYYLPLTAERCGKNYLLYKPSTFSVKTKDGFSIAHFKTVKSEAKIIIKEEWLRGHM